MNVTFFLDRIVEADDVDLKGAVRIDLRRPAAVGSEAQSARTGIETGIEERDARIAAETCAEHLEGLPVGLEREHLAVPVAHVLGKERNGIAVVGPAVDVDFVLAEAQCAIEVPIDHITQVERVEGEPVGDDGVERGAGLLIGQHLGQSKILLAMREQILEQAVIERMRGEPVRRRDLQVGEGHGGVAERAQQFVAAEHAMGGNDDRHIAREPGQRLRRIDAQAGKRRAALSRIAVIGADDLNSLAPADFGEPRPFRPGAEDGECLEAAVAERRLLRQQILAQAGKRRRPQQARQAVGVEIELLAAHCVLAQAFAATMPMPFPSALHNSILKPRSVKNERISASGRNRTCFGA